jgi:hypothetical protein
VVEMKEEKILMFKFGVKALVYKHHVSGILSAVIGAIEFYNFGKLEGEFIVLNTENPFIVNIMKGNGL